MDTKQRSNTSHSFHNEESQTTVSVTTIRSPKQRSRNQALAPPHTDSSQSPQLQPIGDISTSNSNIVTSNHQSVPQVVQTHPHKSSKVNPSGSNSDLSDPNNTTSHAVIDVIQENSTTRPPGQNIQRAEHKIYKAPTTTTTEESPPVQGISTIVSYDNPTAQNSHNPATVSNAMRMQAVLQKLAKPPTNGISRSPSTTTQESLQVIDMSPKTTVQPPPPQMKEQNITNLNVSSHGMNLTNVSSAEMVHSSAQLANISHGHPQPGHHVYPSAQMHAHPVPGGNMFTTSMPMASMEMMHLPFPMNSQPHVPPPGYHHPLVFPQYHVPQGAQRWTGQTNDLPASQVNVLYTPEQRTHPTHETLVQPSDISNSNQANGQWLQSGANIPATQVKTSDSSANGNDAKTTTDDQEKSLNENETEAHENITEVPSNVPSQVIMPSSQPSYHPNMYSSALPHQMSYPAATMPTTSQGHVLTHASAIVPTPSSSATPCSVSGAGTPVVTNAMIQHVPIQSTPYTLPMNVASNECNSSAQTNLSSPVDQGETSVSSDVQNVPAYSPLPRSAADEEVNQERNQENNVDSSEPPTNKQGDEQTGQTLAPTTSDPLPPRQLQCLKPSSKKELSRSRIGVPGSSSDTGSSSATRGEPYRYQKMSQYSNSNGDASKSMDTKELDKLIGLVANIKCKGSTQRARPLICQDITNSNADTLHLSRLPHGVTYDKLRSIVEPFGEVIDVIWTDTDPYVCEVTYKEPSCAHEAKHFLGGAIAGEGGPPLKAELHSREAGAQLFIGDLTPDVTEEMLETTFSELVGESVSALLKRDPESFSPIGYGFLTFRSETAAKIALEKGHRAKIGKACVRVGRAERNTHLYVSDLAPDVTMEDLKKTFGKFGALVDEDTVIVRRSYAFIRYKNRTAAEKAKRTLDKTELKGHISVRYAEAEPLKAVVAVQFHSSVPRPPNSLRDLLLSTFSKHGNCTVEIPRLTTGAWRRVAFVTFHGDPIAANTAALEAVQSVRFVSSFPVCCQFARELIPRIPARGLMYDRNGILYQGERHVVTPSRERTFQRAFMGRRTPVRQGEQVPDGGTGNTQVFEQQHSAYNGSGSGPQNDKYVCITLPSSYVSAIHQQQSGQMPGNTVQGVEGEYAGYQWPGRMIMPANGPATTMHMPNSGVNGNYNSFAPLQERSDRW